MLKVFLFILVFTFTSFPQIENEYLPLISQQTDFIRDRVLIYQGGAHRMDWTQEEFIPYTVAYDSLSISGNWLFNGFLFIEFKDGRGDEYAHSYGNKPARKEDWLWLLERNFGHILVNKNSR